MTTVTVAAIPAASALTITARPRIGSSILAGILSIGTFLGGVGLWAATAPLDSAAVAAGTIIVESRRKTVQHLEGGIVGAILVTEGQRVTAGMPLIRLDDTQARATLETLHSQHDERLAETARLIAERDGAAAIAFPADLTARASDPRVAALMAGQVRLFAARRDSLNGQTGILERRIAQLDAEIAGLEAQVAASDRQLRLIAAETADVAALVAKGLERKPRLLSLERERARLEGLRGDYLSSIARAGQRRGETELQILDQRNRRAEEVAATLREAEAKLTELAERRRAAADVLHRTMITAPTDGVAMNLRIHTTGGVIGAGEALLDIVPAADSLLVEAKLRPTDIDSVHRNLPARVRLTAFKQRVTPVLTGKVVNVSADAVTDQRTDTTFYTAQIAIGRDELARVPGATLSPGMPAEVMIATGTRTALDYLLGPLNDSFARAFREE